LTHYPDLLAICGQVAEKRPSLTFTVCVEQWANDNNTYWPHLHLCIACTSDEAHTIARELHALGMDTKPVPIDDEAHAHYLFTDYFRKGEAPLFYFRKGVILPVLTVPPALVVKEGEKQVERAMFSLFPFEPNYLAHRLVCALKGGSRTETVRFWKLPLLRGP
jgi:hypothetical protein